MRWVSEDAPFHVAGMLPPFDEIPELELVNARRAVPEPAISFDWYPFPTPHEEPFFDDANVK